MKVTGIQLDIAWEDKEANFARARRAIAAAGPEPGSLVVLPEMFATGFSMNVARIAEGRDGPTRRFCAEVAREGGLFLAAGLAAAGDDGRGLNLAEIYGPDGGRIASYAKLHPFSFAGETAHYAPGARLVGAAVGEFLACPLICYDLRFCEPFRTAARGGAEVFIVIANWPAPRADHWRALLIARAIENQACVIGVNRIGSDPNHAYAGGSLIVDHQGRVLGEADDRDAFVQAALDLPALRAWRLSFPVLNDIRDHYPELNA